jgi:dipeptidyl-peptidase-4
VVALNAQTTEGADLALAEPDGDGVTWGLAEFVAAEEMERFRGYWWRRTGARCSPPGSTTRRSCAGTSPTPEHPEKAPAVVAYPAAGTANADVTLWHLGLDGSRTEVAWDRDDVPVPRRASAGATARRNGRHDGGRAAGRSSTGGSAGRWSCGSTRRRARRASCVRTATATGSSWCRERPPLLPGRALVHVVDSEDTRRLCVDGTAVTPPGLQVPRSSTCRTTACWCRQPTSPPRTTCGTSPSTAPSRRSARDPAACRRRGGPAGARVTVLSSATMDAYGRHVVVRSRAGEHRSASHAETPSLLPSVRLLRVGDATAADGTGAAHRVRPGRRAAPRPPRPVRRTARALRRRRAQPLAHRAVVRGPGLRRSRHRRPRDAGPGSCLGARDRRHRAGRRGPDRPGGRPARGRRQRAGAGPDPGGDPRLVASAASCGARRAAPPDVFSAAISGAPVTDWSLYDTYYTERYLGLPDEQPGGRTRART